MVMTIISRCGSSPHTPVRATRSAVRSKAFFFFLLASLGGPAGENTHRALHPLCPSYLIFSVGVRVHPPSPLNTKEEEDEETPHQSPTGRGPSTQYAVRVRAHPSAYLCRRDSLRKYYLLFLSLAEKTVKNHLCCLFLPPQGGNVKCVTSRPPRCFTALASPRG